MELTRKGDRLVTDLTEAHLAELHKLADALGDLLSELDQEYSGRAEQEAGLRRQL